MIQQELDFASNATQEMSRVPKDGKFEISTSKALVEVMKYELFDKTFILLIIFSILWQLPKESY